MPSLTDTRLIVRRALATTGVLPLAFNVYQSVRKWRPGMVVRNARLRRAAPPTSPLPPSGLVFAVAGSRDLDWFVRTGRAGADAIRAALAAVGRPIESFEAILDFGCGCGRVLRHFADLPPGRLHGSDYDPAAIAWLQRHVAFVRAARNDLRPPLPCGDGAFDLIYALSVFTHLPLGLQHAWMAELRRVLRPGGVLILTTMGEHFLPRLTPPERAAFHRGEMVVRDAQYAGTNVCASYHPEGWVRRELAKDFTVLAFTPAGAAGNPGQDLYVLERSAPAERGVGGG
jgi:SAM-dependent methyltransferase